MDVTVTRVHRLLPVLLALIACPLFSATTDPRDRFLEAEQALRGGDRDQFLQHKAQLKDYPLYPYLEYQELLANLKSTDSQHVETFLTDHASTPLARRMRIVWLGELVRRKQWLAFNIFYRPGLGRTNECHHLNALIQTDQRQEALDQVKTLWLQPDSQPKACDPVFDAWIDAGQLTPELAWQRVELAMAESETRLARYLGRYLDTEKQALLDEWLRMHRDPSRILDGKTRTALAGEERETILLHGFRRLLRKDLERAIAAWDGELAAYPFTGTQRYQGERSLLIAMKRADHPDVLTRMERLPPNADDDYLQETRLHAALKRMDWERTARWIDALPDQMQQSERWRYWRARALESLGRADEADNIYSDLAGERSYHGYLAADHRATGYRFDPVPLQPEPSRLNSLSQRPGLQRAYELFQLERYTEARREWLHDLKGLNGDQLQLASKLAQSWDWHDQAIFTLARTSEWDDLDLRFPIDHRDLVNERAGQLQMESAWIFAIIRQESAFFTHARSPAGAMGLMQLMPRTARFIAGKTRHPKPSKGDLNKPKVNITLGTAYLNRVFNQLGNNQVLATAAYNAGPHRVKAWLPDASIPADIWIETIPFKETRRYTQRVLTYMAIYEFRMGETPTQLSERMRPILPEEKLLAQADGISGGSAAL
jgi:soluble lytic murein transglycosylase